MKKYSTKQSIILPCRRQSQGEAAAEESWISVEICKHYEFRDKSQSDRLNWQFASPFFLKLLLPEVADRSIIEPI